MNYNDQMKELMQNPQAMGQKAGYNIPEEIKDPQAIFQHLMQTGQISNPVLQRLMPMLRMLTGK